MTAVERKQAYLCDVTYTTANEAGFDFLRDQIAMYPAQQVHRQFAAVLIDEADSILVDEARIPLVLAGGQASDAALVYRVDQVTRRFRRGTHYVARQIQPKRVFDGYRDSCRGARLRLREPLCRGKPALFTAVQESLHAHALLHRNVDYLVKDGVIESIDEFKGRIVPDRRWPSGLHAAVEAKEGVAAKAQGKILGSITIPNLIALYPRVCGMTGTAATQAEEFRAMHGARCRGYRHQQAGHPRRPS